MVMVVPDDQCSRSAELISWTANRGTKTPTWPYDVMDDSVRVLHGATPPLERGHAVTGHGNGVNTEIL